MERATQRDELGYYLVGDAIYGDCGVPEKFRGDDVDRLAAYENTGMEPEDFKRAFTEDALLKLTGQLLGVTPDRLRELAQADREGLWHPSRETAPKIFRVFNGKVYEEIVCSATWEPFTPRPRWKVWVMGSGFPYYWNEVIGKTVFLTREEAEAALRRKRNEGVH